uniref:F-box domain-containing protein n=1 Tax=Loa loa TaxID=7209 RepID=A0A1I7VRN7_LOALO
MDAITESPGQYWPVSHKYDTIDRKYKFFKATNAYRMQAYYPLIQLGRASYSSARRDVTSLKSKISVGIEMDAGEFPTNSSVKEEILTTVNDLSDDILLTVFGYCHPVDLIHGCSLVCRRWNYLANYSSLFTEVRVLVDDFSLKYGSVKMFFHRTSQYLRKLCIDCPVPLPSAEVNALFDIYFPNVIHLDLGSLKEMNTALLKKLSNCFPNVETLHMEKIERSSKCDDNAQEWGKTLKMLFEDESIFPKVQNFFVGNVSAYSSESDPKLPACNRPLNLLHIYDGMGEIDFSVIRTSPWRSTLTELHLGSHIRNDGIEYIGLLQNLKVFSWGLSLYTFDEEFAHIKARKIENMRLTLSINLYNLEELRIFFGGEDCNVSPDGLIALFTLPDKEPEKSFPYKLKHLVIANYFETSVDLLQAINRNCPDLRTLGLPFNEYSLFRDEIMPFIISKFKHLIFLDLSNFGECYKDEVWNNLKNDDLPDLCLLKLHGNKVNIEDLQRLNLRRPKLLISTRVNHFINWTKIENSCIFHDTFDGDIRAIENDLRQIDGLRDFEINAGL